MASTPKRRGTRKSSQQPSSLMQENQKDDISQLETCLAADILMAQETVRQCILSSRQQQETPTIA